MPARIVLVYVTISNKQEAERVARKVVAERIAACANLLGPIRSIYRWKGNVEEGDEWALLLKTRAARLPHLIARVRSLHSYEVPCIVAIPIVGGHRPFLQWIAAETRPPCRTSSAPAPKRKR